jgi:hypothetical protein
MNLSKKTSLLLVAAVTFSFSLLSCGNNIVVEAPDDEVQEAREGAKDYVDYKSYVGGEAALFVENQSNSKLVAFQNRIDKDYLLGGIPAGAKAHGLKKTALFTSSGDFPLVLITEDEFKKNIDNLDQAVVFTTIYAFYNKDAANNTIFKISASAGGKGRIVLRNPSKWNIEIRKDAPDGEILGYVAAGNTNGLLRVEAPEDYILFPIFKKFTNSALTGPEIYEVVPKYPDGDLEGLPFSRGFALEGEEPQIWNLNELTQGINLELSAGAIFINIQNNNSGTSVKFMQGSQELSTSVGIKGIPSSKSSQFAIKVPRNPDGKYPKSFTLNGLKVSVTAGIERLIPSTTFDLDYVYTIFVDGTNQSNVSLMTGGKWLETLTLSAQNKAKVDWFAENAEALYVDPTAPTEDELVAAEVAWQTWLGKVWIEKSEKLDVTKLFN